MKKLAFLAVIALGAFGAGSLFTSCCCNDANAPKLPAQPKFSEAPVAQPAFIPVMPSKK